METFTEAILNTTCLECTNPILPNSPSVKRLKRVYCRECWIHYCDFRLRKRVFQLARPEKLGPRRSSNSNLSRPSEQVIIDFDGSQSALALLYLIRDTILAQCRGGSLDTKSTLPLPFKFSVFFAHDEVGSTKEVTTKDLNLLRSWQVETWSKFGLDFPIILSSLESSLAVMNGHTGGGEANSRLWRTITVPHNEDSIVDISHEGTIIELNALSLPFDTSLNARLSTLANNLKSQTSRIDFLRQLRRNLLVAVGNEFKFTTILSAEDQSSMAVKMFSIMSLGRGAQLAEEMGFTTQIQGIKFARPLMDLTCNDLRDYMECVYWDPGTGSGSSLTTTATTHSKVETSTSLPIDKRTESKAATTHSKGGKSIDAQCEEFILDLQDGYPSTVPTLTRIGAKLQSPNAEGAETHDDGISSVHSTCRFCKRHREWNEEDSSSNSSNLCYGCTNILKDMKDQSLFMELIHQS